MDLLRLALQSGACPNERSNRGSTILMTSALQGELETLKLAHEHGADVDLSDREGKTAIMHAVIGQNKDCVEYLLDVGEADVTLKCHDNKTAVVYARELGLGDICDKIRPVLAKQLSHILEHGPREVDNSKGYNIPPCLRGRHNSRPKTAETLCQATANGRVAVELLLRESFDHPDVQAFADPVGLGEVHSLSLCAVAGTTWAPLILFDSFCFASTETPEYFLNFAFPVSHPIWRFIRVL